MKIFKMNECDWVCALDEEKAIAFYVEAYGDDYLTEEEAPIECSMTTKYIWWGINDGELENIQKLLGRDDIGFKSDARGDWKTAVRVNYEEALKIDPPKSDNAYIFASTEY